VGSILAAVGTALPETIIPIIAILVGATADSESIGIGAIVGSSFMLATLALCVTGVAVAVFSSAGRRDVFVKADPAVLERDLRFFIIAYGATILAAVLEQRPLQIAVAASLIVAYGVYVYRTVSQDEASGHALRSLYFHPKADTPHIAPTILQMLAALAIIIGGARFFVGGIETAAHALAIPALVFSMLVTPFATELPEKLNSVLWIRGKKDTLALGNITGAMLFQACILPAVGIMLTPWNLTTPALVAAGLGITSALAAYVQVLIRGNLHYRHLIGMGLLYAGFAVYTLTFGL
jgi:cation:H+ antiporter